MKLPTFFIVAVLLGCSGFASSQAKQQEIIRIRKIFQQINTDTALRHITLDAEKFTTEITDGGASLTGWFKNNSLQKIARYMGISTGISILEYYFKDDVLIFVYEEFNTYRYDEKKKAPDYYKTEQTFQGRYYFRHNQLIDYITTGHNRFEDDALDPEKILSEEAYKYQQLLKSHWRKP
ncbi:hypothetical protein [Chitinophaga nivalis]|uniref:DUF4468 domain-containing protein n=1 Tax=Chitinophaga nivalis TaxID=2991709 RepID=A0ABT3IKS7_9BACT|nr:hypothetical protein [Chitinophaga nivalis]MCW3465737.1 hypothetical protein [Chitinophaga nivalis]MCW3484572.1 hypothetical protein [Chitinophaga nivalis]